MRVWGRVLVMGCALLIAVVGQAQIVPHLTPEQISEAIALGTKSKNVQPYRIQEKARFSWPPLIGVYTTPFLRVELAANEAKKRYQSFKATDVTAAMLAPEIDVYAPAQSIGDGGVANVVTVVLLPHNSKDPASAVHPTRAEEIPQEFKNLFGFKADGRGLVAVFPLSDWKEGYDVHVVFDAEIPSSVGYGRGSCTDCKSRIYLKHIR